VNIPSGRADPPATRADSRPTALGHPRKCNHHAGPAKYDTISSPLDPDGS